MRFEDVWVLDSAGYTRTKPVGKPKLGTLLPMSDTILVVDRTAPAKHLHTAERIGDDVIAEAFDEDFASAGPNVTPKPARDQP